MAGVRTAPALTAAASARELTIHLLDYSNDNWTINLDVPVAATAANLETLVDAIADGSNCTVWKVEDNQTREGTRSVANAGSDGTRLAGEKGINMLFKPTAGSALKNIAVRLFAPVSGAMDATGLDIPNTASVELDAIADALETLWISHTRHTMQFTTHRERNNNPKTPIASLP